MDWFNAYLLTVNITKTKVIPFSSLEEYLPDYTNVLAGTQSIPTVSSIKYLGIYIDSEMGCAHQERCQQIKGLRGIIPKMYQLRLPVTK